MNDDPLHPATTETNRLASSAEPNAAAPRTPEGASERGASIREKALEILRREFPPEAPEQATGEVSPGVPGEVESGAAVAPGVEKAPSSPSAAPAETEPRAETIPARMLNEFVYCPRLFYYEFVEGVFVESADTVRGSSLHQRVDKGKGDLPPAEEPSAEKGERKRGKESAAGDAQEASATARSSELEKLETIHSRSVSLGSERLGVTAKMDLVEVRMARQEPPAGETMELFSEMEVCPVDYKAGAPREGEDGNELWDTDKMQLGLQALILRDNGYTCNEGVIYYRTTKQRVRLPITPELEAWILQKIEAARLATAGPIPPPLVNSPKCTRCSLAPVCLPDETRMLAESSATKGEGNGEPRRLIAARDDRRALYLNKPGLRIGISDGVLQIKDKEKLLDEVRINDVCNVALLGNIQVSTQTVQALCEEEVPISYFSMGGWFYGLTRGHGLKNVFLRVEQFRLASDGAASLRLARQFVHGKIRNHRTMLMRNHLEPPESTLLKLKNSAETTLAAGSMEELLGIEGAAAAFYFEQFGGMIKVAEELGADEAARASERPVQLRFNFTQRNRRPPTDPVNALLSLAYSVLARDCTVAVLAVGFDPYVGFYHQPRFGRPALALDLMEEFRPLIAESTVLNCVNNRVITESDFVRAGKAVNLSADGRKRFFQIYEQRMNSLLTHPVFDYKVSYRRALELQARILARALTGEIPDYVPLTTR